MQQGESIDEVNRQFLASPQGQALKQKISEIIDAVGGQNIRGPVVTLALQQPDGAFVLGWNGHNTGGRWRFSSLHTVDTVRRRASDWDGNVGLAGAVVAEPEETADEREGESTEEQPGSEEAPRAPGRMNTPAGPLTIPGQ
jgi:hypothetical protein